MAEDKLEFWVESVKQGNKDDFEHIYTYYFKYVYYIALKNLGNKEQAEDLVQEVFIKVYKNIRDVKDIKSLTSWIRQITLNEYRLLIREKYFLKNKGKKVDIDGVEDNLLGVDEKFYPENILEKEENKKLILELINDLPKKQRAVVFSYYFLELSYKEMATELNTTESAVKNALFKGRNNLKVSLEKTFERKGNFLGIGLVFQDVFKFEWQHFKPSLAIQKGVWEKLLRRLTAVPKGQFFKRSLNVVIGVLLILLVSGFSVVENKEPMGFLDYHSSPAEIIKTGVFKPQNKDLIQDLKTTTKDRYTEKKTIGVEEHAAQNKQLSIENTALVNGEKTNTVTHHLKADNVIVSSGKVDNENGLMDKEALVGLGLSLALCQFVRGNKRSLIKLKKLKRVRKKIIATMLSGMMLFSFVVPVFAQEVETMTVPPMENEVSVMPASGSLNDGFSLDTKILKSLDGVKPIAGYLDEDTVDLTGINRNSLFYVYLEINYNNQSGKILKNPKIQLQMPMAGEATNVESDLAKPKVSVDGNSIFQAGNMTFNSSTNLMVWTGSSAIPNSASGTLYVKIPLHDPYTHLGSFTYNLQLTYDDGVGVKTAPSFAKLNLSGVKEESKYDVTRINALGYVPAESDADDYYYHKYRITYVKDARVLDWVYALYSGKITLPNGAEIVSIGKGTLQDGKIVTKENTDIVIRYPKAIYTDPDESITIASVINGRYYGESWAQARDLAETLTAVTHKVGEATVIPEKLVGTITGSNDNFSISEEALKLDAVSFSNASYIGVERINSTVVIDELTYGFKGINWVKDGIESEADYGITTIKVLKPFWTGQEDPLKPVEIEGRVYFNDGTSDVLFHKVGADVLLASANVYSNENYVAPSGKVAKRVEVTLKNAPANSKIPVLVSGYVKNYPIDGADRLRHKITREGYTYDTGLGREKISGSGDFSKDFNIVKNTKFQPLVTIAKVGIGSVNPGGSDVVNVKAAFGDKSKQSFLNPSLHVLLPQGYSYDTLTDKRNEKIALSHEIGPLSEPHIEVIENWKNTGRTLVTVKYDGVLQQNESIGFDLKLKVSAVIPVGNHGIDVYMSADNPGFENALDSMYTPIVDDDLDYDNDGINGDKLFGQKTNLVVTRGLGTRAFTAMKGSYDYDFTVAANTKQNTTIDGKLALEYNGALPMEGIELVSRLPFEGDGTTLYGHGDENRQVLLKEAVDLSDYPGAVAYYNLNGTDNQNDSGWESTFAEEAKAVKIVMPDNFVLVNGGTEAVEIPLKLQVPGTENPADIFKVEGVGLLELRAYADTVLNTTSGFEGSNSVVNSNILGINVKVFEDLNVNGIKEVSENWSENIDVRLFNENDDVNTATPLYTGLTDVNGSVSFTDGIGVVDLENGTYQVVVENPGGIHKFTTAIGDVTTDNTGQERVTLDTNKPVADILAGYSGKVMTVEGYYWKDGEKPVNGIKNDSVDSVDETTGRIVRVFNVTKNSYETLTGTVDSSGFYQIDNLPIGDQYSIEFPFDGNKEFVSPKASGHNMLEKTAEGIGSYTFNTMLYDDGDTQVINGAIYENGKIKISFSTDGIDRIGASKTVTKQLPTTYLASVGAVENTVAEDSGTFVVPAGYRLLSSEPLSKTAIIDFNEKNQEIVFLIEALSPDLNGLKTSSGTGQGLLVGDEIEYTLRVSNTGTEDAVNTLIKDHIPEGTVFVSGSQGIVFEEGKVSWVEPLIAADGGVSTKTFKVKVLDKDRLETSWSIVNDRATVNGVAINSTTDYVKKGLLKSFKKSDVPENTEVAKNSQIEYRIQVENMGEAPLENIKITDKIPEHTTLVEGSISQGGVLTEDEISYEIQTLLPGEEKTLVFKVQVTGDTTEKNTISNTAVVDNIDTNTVKHQVGDNNSQGLSDPSNIVKGERPPKLPQTGGYIFGVIALISVGVGSGILFWKWRSRKNK